MLINDKDAAARLSSPMNLMNRLRASGTDKGNKKNSAMSLFGIGKKTEDQPKAEKATVTFNPFSKKEELQTPLPSQPSAESLVKTEHQIESSGTETLDNILDNHDSQIRLGLAHDKALELLNNSVAMLATKLDDVKADKLPAVISAASKTVESIRRERNEQAKTGKDKEVHYHFYTPVQKPVTSYRVIDVAESVA